MKARRPSTPTEQRIGGLVAPGAATRSPRTAVEWYRELAAYVPNDQHGELLLELADVPLEKLEQHFGPRLARLRSERRGGR